MLRLLAAQQGLALAALRMVMGVLLGYAGQAKVFRGDWAVSTLDGLGLPLPHLLGPLLSLLELAGGLALFVGLFTRVVGLLFAAEFLVATLVMINLHGPLGAQLEMMLLMGSVVLATHGAGAFALDRPGQRWEP